MAGEENRKLDTRKIAIISLMAAISVGLSYVEIPLTFFAPWLKLDFSNVPMLLTGFSMGLGEAFIVLAIKELIWLARTDSFGVGQLANLLLGAVMLLPAVICYQRSKTRKNALIGMLIGVLLMAVAGVLTNKYMMLPFYALLMGERIVAYLDAHPMILWTAVVPFNLLKGFSVSLITFILYKRLSPFIKKGLKG